MPSPATRTYECGNLALPSRATPCRAAPGRVNFMSAKTLSCLALPGLAVPRHATPRELVIISFLQLAFDTSGTSGRRPVSGTPIRAYISDSRNVLFPPYFITVARNTVEVNK